MGVCHTMSSETTKKLKNVTENDNEDESKPENEADFAKEKIGEDSSEEPEREEPDTPTNSENEADFPNGQDSSEEEEEEEEEPDTPTTPFPTPSIGDLPGEIICYIAQYLPQRSIMCFFLIQTDFEALCRNNGFYEKKMNGLRVPFDRRNTQNMMKKVYVRTIRNIRMKQWWSPDLGMLKGIKNRKFIWEKMASRSLNISNSVATLKNESRHVIVVVRNDVGVMQKHLYHGGGSGRIRCVRYFLRLSMFGRESRIGFKERIKNGNFTPNRDICEGLLYTLEDLGFERINEEDEVEMTLTMSDNKKPMNYSVAFKIRGKVVKLEEKKRKRVLTDNTVKAELHLFMNLTKRTEKFGVIGCVWNRSEPKRFIEKSKIENGVEDFNIMGIERIRRIGNFASGEVWKVRDEQTRKVYAMKEVTLHRTVANKLRWVRIVEQLLGVWRIIHPNIIRVENFFADDHKGEIQSIQILLEYMNCGSLEKILKTSKTFSERAVSQCSKQVLEALVYYHDMGLIHRDIEPSKIRVNDKGLCKLSELKLDEMNERQFNCFVGTCFYMSPERIKGEVHSFNSDCYSVGIMAVELATGKYPFPTGNNNLFDLLSIMEKIIDEKKILPEGEFSEEFVDFVDKAMKTRADERWESTQLLKHPFITTHQGKKPSFRSWLHKKYIKPKKEAFRRAQARKMKRGNKIWKKK